MNLQKLFLLLSLVWISLNSCRSGNKMNPELGHPATIGGLGGIFAKSELSGKFFFLQPYSMMPGGRIYEFSSLEDLVASLPVVGMPIYWLNYSSSQKQIFKNEEVVALSDIELKYIESKCTGGIVSFPRSENEFHPALPQPPSKRQMSGS